MPAGMPVKNQTVSGSKKISPATGPEAVRTTQTHHPSDPIQGRFSSGEATAKRE